MTTPPEKKPITGWQRSVVVGVDRMVYWISRHWLGLFNGVIFLYVALPILAPVLMNAGVERPARVIYRVYSPLCHQMAQRSFFLFGEQSVYPREIAGTDLIPIEAYTATIPEFSNVDDGDWPAFFVAARRFVGNEQMGFKMALCERDIGIYGFVLIGGLVYAMLRNRIRIRPLPFILFVVIGIGPIAIDGFSQLFSYWVTPAGGGQASGFLGWVQGFLQMRESTPTIRALTGGLFGFTLAWLAYPQVEIGMRGTERQLAEKLRRIDDPSPPAQDKTPDLS